MKGNCAVTLAERERIREKIPHPRLEYRTELNMTKEFAYVVSIEGKERSGIVDECECV